MKFNRNASPDERNITQRWHKDELCVVTSQYREYELVYRWNSYDEMEVMIPGMLGGYTVRQLRDRGLAVRLPRNVRSGEALRPEMGK